jgi:hypothetical protein
VSLEIVNTVATTVTALVIGATAIAALVQLRHLRAANQITALLAVQNELDSADFREAEIIVRQDLKKMIEDPAYCRFEAAMSIRAAHGEADPRYVKLRQSVNLIGNTFENVGSMVKNGILDERLVMDIYAWIFASNWDQLVGVIAIARAATGQQGLYENFEYLAAISKRYLDSNPVTYPARVKRLRLELPAAARSLALED